LIAARVIHPFQYGVLVVIAVRLEDVPVRVEFMVVTAMNEAKNLCSVLVVMQRVSKTYCIPKRPNIDRNTR